MKHPPLTAGRAAVVAKIETVRRRHRRQQPGVLVVLRGGGGENKILHPTHPHHPYPGKKLGGFRVFSVSG